MTFADAIAPLSTEIFTERYLTREYLRVEGHSSKFSDLVPWSALNDNLRTIRVAGTRVRLVQNGVPVERTEYLEDAGSPSGSLLRSHRTTRLLKDGATLIVNQVDELFPLIRTLVESCEDEFRIGVKANLYAAWRAEKGFDLHWDDHDTIILQVAGRKKWQVYTPTRLHPIRNDASGRAPRPSSPPVWSGVLDQGYLLYMPRGWWHVACAMDEPTLHITIALGHLRGIDLLRWLVEQLQRYTDVRRALPHHGSRGEQLAYTETLRGCLMEAMSADIIERFMRVTDRNARPRPLFRLPDSARTEAAATTADIRIRLAVGRRLHCELQPETGRVTFLSAGRTWTCDARLAPALEMLRANESCLFINFKHSVEPGLRLPLHLFAEMLAANGVVTFE